MTWATLCASQWLFVYFSLWIYCSDFKLDCLYFEQRPFCKYRVHILYQVNIFIIIFSYLCLAYSFLNIFLWRRVSNFCITLSSIFHDFYVLAKRYLPTSCCKNTTLYFLKYFKVLALTFSMWSIWSWFSQCENPLPSSLVPLGVSIKI